MRCCCTSSDCINPPHTHTASRACTCQHPLHFATLPASRPALCCLLDSVVVMGAVELLLTMVLLLMMVLLLVMVLLLMMVLLLVVVQGVVQGVMLLLAVAEVVLIAVVHVVGVHVVVVQVVVVVSRVVVDVVRQQVVWCVRMRMWVCMVVCVMRVIAHLPIVRVHRLSVEHQLWLQLQLRCEVCWLWVGRLCDEWRLWVGLLCHE